MTIQRILLALLLPLTGALAQTADEQRTQATLRQATVFLNRAQLSAQVRATLDAGTTRLIIDNAPAQTDPQSIQVAGRGDAVIQGVQFRTNFLSKAPKPAALQRLEDSLRLNRETYEALLLQEEVLQEEKKLVLANKQVGEKDKGATVEAVEDMADFYRERLTDVGRKLLSLQRQLRLQKERVDRLDAQVREQNARRERPVGEIEITLTARSRTTVELDLNYVVAGAGWMPVYDVRIRDTKSPASLAYKAYVFQSTGFDWQNVRLTLSTANPTLGGTAPTLTTQYVGVYDPNATPPAAFDGQTLNETVTIGYGARPKAVERAVEATPKEEDIVSTARFTNVVDQPTNVAFQIAVPYTILTNSRPQLVDIQRLDLPATYRYETTPKLDTDAFLMAQVTGWDKLNLLNGTARIYFEGTFVGESQVKLGEANDTLTLSLGRDRRIITKREQIDDYSARKLLGGNLRDQHGYRLTLRNTKNEPVSLTVYDQLPVSTDSRVEITPGNLTGAEPNSETGRLTWRLTLQPNETRTLTFRYEVKYPKGRTLTGL